MGAVHQCILWPIILIIHIGRRQDEDGGSGQFQEPAAHPAWLLCIVGHPYAADSTASDRCFHSASRDRVTGRSGLIQQEYRRSQGQRQRQHDSLRLAARKSGPRLVKDGLFQAKIVNQRREVPPRPASLRFQLLALQIEVCRCALQLHARLQHIQNMDSPQWPPNGSWALTTQHYAASLQPIQACNAAQQQCLATPGRSTHKQAVACRG
mmetsp:Transcript_9209/g.16188  ORF Transcript_9209/g.16188 Transcript_9209/m.16188 type:complete len:209 (-) Transcript_9209:218-844(-)